MFTYDELTTIGKALEHYEACGVADDLEASYKGELLSTVFGNGDNIKQITKEADKLANEYRKTIDTRKEQLVLLRAKLIGLKDKAIAEEI